MTNEIPEKKEQVFFDGDSYFENLLLAISQAKISIDLETYIFEPDALGKRVANALIEAAKRGVKVRVLVDGAGTPSWGGSLTRQLEKASIETRIFHPLPWRLWQWGRSHVRVPTLLKIVYFAAKINSRNHRKVCIIDNHIVFIGSNNIAQCHLSKINGGKNWRDTAVRLENIHLRNLLNAFEAAWSHTAIQERIRELFKTVRHNPTFRLNNTWYRRRVLQKNLLMRIRKATQRIWITNAYFVPDNFILKALRDLAEKKIDVKILIPKKSDVLFMPWATATFYENLLRSGARIFEYLPSMLHAKTLIIDDWYLVGSSNLNHRSLLHDLEVDINPSSPEVKSALERQFLIDLGKSREVTYESWQKRHWFKRMMGRLVLYLKYWI